MNQNLLQLLKASFNVSEFEELCYDMNINAEDLRIPHLAGRADRLRALILHCWETDRIPELLQHCRELRPRIVWPEATEVISDLDFLTTTAMPVPFQVPATVPNFVGREQKLQQLKDHLRPGQSHQVFGLVGFGGVGKTAVAIQRMSGIQDAFPDGILWARLDHSTPAAELTSFAAAFGQAETIAKFPDLPNKSNFVRELLAHKKCLVVLDQAQNHEQIQWLLPRGQDNVTLITTRNRKLLQTLDTVILEVETFSPEISLRFLETAVGQERVSAEREAAAHIVEHVGNLPLALSIVAGFLNEAEDLTLAEYDDLLQDEQTRLENLADWEDAERDVAASFELSYQTLPPPMQTLFAALAVFDGPDFAAEAVAAVVKMPLARVKIGLGRLFSLSLIGSGLGSRDDLFATELDDSNRYRLNPLLQTFARRKLDDDDHELRQRAATYYAGLAESHRLPAAFGRLDLEWQNILGAMRWAHEHEQWPDLTQAALALTHPHLGTMGYLDARGRWNEARQLLAWAADGLESVAIWLDKARLLAQLGGFAARQGEMDTAVSHLQQSWQLLAAGPVSAEQQVLQAYICSFFFQAHRQRERETAAHWAKQLQTLLRVIPADAYRHELGYLLVSLSAMLGSMGQMPAAQKAASQGLKWLPETPSAARVSGLSNLGIILQRRGDLADAVRFYLQAVNEGLLLGNLMRTVQAGINLASAYDQQGDFPRALTAFESALKWATFMGDVSMQVLALNGIGLLQLRWGDDEQAKAALLTCIELAGQYELGESEAEARLNLATLLLHQERPSYAQYHLDRAQTLCQALTLNHLQPELQRLQAQIQLAQGQWQLAQASVDQSLQQAAQLGDSLETGLGWRVRGDILAAQQQHEEAEAAYRRSLEMIDDQEKFERACTELALARFYRDTKVASDNVVGLLQAALDTFTQLDARRELAQAQALLAERP